MMLCKLSLKNIQKSFKDYAIYFFTLILGVSIFYVFNAIESQTVLMDVTASTHDIIELMQQMLSGVSVFVSFILGFLIIYASRFLILRRNKEFGIYLTLGMSKRKISMILLLETLFIGLISLFVGLAIGVVLSQFMSLLVANMFDANMTRFSFVFSLPSFIKTCCYFGMMYVLVMFFNTIMISKCKLIDLLHGSKKSEKIRMKNPLLCILVFILASSCLGCAYYMVTVGVNTLQTANQILIPIGMGIVSTFFLFWSVSGLLLKFASTRKNFYYKGLNSFTLRQISSKINTTVFSMSMICIMLFLTICILSSSLSIKNSMSANIRELAPADIYLRKILESDNQNTVREILEDTIHLEDYFKEYVELSVYQTEDLTFGKMLGSYFEEASKQFQFLGYNRLEKIVTISDYNRLARLYGNKEYVLNEGEYIILADFESMVQLRNQALKERPTIEIAGKILSPKYDKCQDGFLEISSNHINDGIILVPDSAVSSQLLYSSEFVANYNVEGKSEKQAKENQLIASLEKMEDDFLGSTRLEIAEASIGLGALVTFIGLYLGIIFLISSAAILALKELSESSDNKTRYWMLQKLGVDNKMLKKALLFQIAIFFLFPLILALIHSIFGIWFCNILLATFGNDKLLPSIIMTAIFLTIIYGGYFLITYLCSKTIIQVK